MNQSSLYAINWRDALRGLILAIGTPVLVAVERQLDAGKIDFSWKSLAMIGVGAGLTYMTKNFFTSPPGK